MLETERLILRRWEDGDAENLYEYNKQERVVTLGELTLASYYI